MTDHLSHDGPSCTTVLVVRDPVPKGLSFFLTVLLRTHATYGHWNYRPSFTNVLVIIDPVPKGLSLFLIVLQLKHATDRYSHDGPSFTYRHDGQSPYS